MLGTGSASAHRRRARAQSALACSDPYPAARDPSNPLDLPTAPGANPLNGARFFVPGPAHGVAAQTIAHLVGASVGQNETWVQFSRDLEQGALAAKLRDNPRLAHEVAELSKIAALPHTVVYVEGGYSDSNSVGYAARILNAIGVRHIRGFYTNDTHLNWTINEVRWATAISGTFWLQRAVGLAERANQRLGPSFPSRPY